MHFKYKIGNCDYNNTGSKFNQAEVEWRLHDGKFSASGGIWKSNKSDYETCGQMVDELLKYFPDDQLLQRIVQVWKKWHLNDLTAGSPKQMEFLEQIGPGPSGDYYSWAVEKLTEAGLNPDPDLTYNDKPYMYGSAWLHTEIPASVVAEIESWSTMPGVQSV